MTGQNDRYPFPTRAELKEQVDGLKEQVDGLGAVKTVLTPVTPSFATNWADFNPAANDPYQTVIRQGNDTRVTLTLAARKNATITANETVMTLPAGCRPPKQVVTTAVLWASGWVGTATLIIGTDGSVVVANLSTTATGLFAALTFVTA